MGRKISEEEKINFIKKILATGFYIGYAPVAPATLACIISVIIWYFLVDHDYIYIVLSILLFIAGLLISHDLTKLWGKDPHEIVIDEYACLLMPLYFTPRRILPLVITFVVFRIFDILKPPPLRQIEHLKGGWGIMLDDLGAAVYTSVVAILVNSIFKL